MTQIGRENNELWQEWTSAEYQEYLKTGKKPSVVGGKVVKGHKYNAVSCRCSQDHRHDSKLEASVCNKLHLKFHLSSIDTQKTFTFYVNEKKITSHRVDFLVTHPGGDQEVYEAKGLATGIWKLKHKLFEALYPEIPYNTIYRKDVEGI